VIWFPPSEKHWHDASPNYGDDHIAIQEQLDGRLSTGWRRFASIGAYSQYGVTGADALIVG
jgi:hypothetical protein